MELAILKRRFFDTAVADILRAIDGRALVGAMTLSLCVIDYLAYLRPVYDEKHPPCSYCGRGGRESGHLGCNYKAFVRDFLTERVEPKYVPEQVYALRCALVHTYAQSRNMKRTGLDGYDLGCLEPSFHLSVSDNLLRLNVESFVTDIVWQTWLFFDDPGDPRKIEERSNELLVVKVSDVEANKLYGDMHRALRELDTSSPNRDSLYADISAILQPDSEKFQEDTTRWVKVSMAPDLTGSTSGV